MDLDAPPHPLDLLPDRACQIVCSFRIGAIGFMRENRERRLEAVRQVCGARPGAAKAAASTSTAIAWNGIESLGSIDVFQKPGVDGVKMSTRKRSSA